MNFELTHVYLHWPVVQSADVSRLKTRWVPTSHQGHASSGRDSSGPSIGHDSRAVDTTLLANSSEDIACPMLDIDTTSPSTFRRTETGTNIEEHTPPIVNFTQCFGSSAWPPSEHQRQERPLGMTPSLNADPHSLGFASKKAVLAYQGSGEPSEVSDSGQEYESRILGSECLPSSTMLRATGRTPPYGKHDNDSGVTSSFAGEDNGAPVFSGYSNKQLRIGNAMLPKVCEHLVSSHSIQFCKECSESPCACSNECRCELYRKSRFIRLDEEGFLTLKLAVHRCSLIIGESTAFLRLGHRGCPRRVTCIKLYHLLPWSNDHTSGAV